MSDWSGWAQDVLTALGDPVTNASVQFLQTWHNFEGGGASFNPLNTTQTEPGSTVYNNNGVRNYTSAAQGAKATVTTLTNGRYPALLAALKTGDPYTYIDPNGVATNLQTWGSKTFVPVYLTAAGSFQGTGGTPPPPIVAATGAGVAPSAHRGYADLRNSVSRHVPTQLQRSTDLGAVTLRVLRSKTKVRGR